MGTQSTPKGSVSRAHTGPESPSLSISMTISSLQSESELQSQSASSIAQIDDTFAVGASTIIGEDVFGLTIAIDADGSTRPLSPDRSSDTTPTRGYTTRWFEPPEEEYSNYLQEREEFDRLVEFAEVDVPVDFGDENSGDEGGDTLQPIPPEMTEEWSDDVDPTRIWDITVPIRETSVLSDGFNFEDDISGLIDVEAAETSVQSSQHKFPEIGEDEEAPRRDKGTGRPRKYRTQRESEMDISQTAGPDRDPVETSRGLNISKIGLDNLFDDPPSHAMSLAGLDDQEAPCLENHLPENETYPNLPNAVGEIDDVDYTTRIQGSRSLAREDSPHFSSFSTGETSSVASVNTPKEPLGCKADERYTQGGSYLRIPPVS